jgi:hypothetical protein
MENKIIDPTLFNWVKDVPQKYRFASLSITGDYVYLSKCAAKMILDMAPECVLREDEKHCSFAADVGTTEKMLAIRPVKGEGCGVRFKSKYDGRFYIQSRYLIEKLNRPKTICASVTWDEKSKMLIAEVPSMNYQESNPTPIKTVERRKTHPRIRGNSKWLD